MFEVGVFSPCNKALFIETQPFERQLYKDFAVHVFENFNTSIMADVVDDILETTCGHPGLSMWMLIKATQQSIGHKCLTRADWLNSKRRICTPELYNTPAMTKMLQSVQSSKEIAKVLHVLIWDYQVSCAEVHVASFLRAVGIAKPLYCGNFIAFTIPIIRDFLLQENCSTYDNVHEIVDFCDSTRANFVKPPS
jgi:hypothetical protein